MTVNRSARLKLMFHLAAATIVVMGEKLGISDIGIFHELFNVSTLEIYTVCWRSLQQQLMRSTLLTALTACQPAWRLALTHKSGI